MKLFIKYLKKYILRYSKKFLISFSIVIFLTLLSILIPTSLRYCLQYLQTNGRISVIMIIIIGFSLLFLIKNLIDICWSMSLNTLGGMIILDIRTGLINSIINFNYEDLLAMGRDKLKNIVFMDTLDIFRSIVHISVNIVANILLLIVFLSVSLYINPILGTVLIIASGLGFLMSMASRKAILKASRKVNEAMKIDNETQNELIDSIEVLKTNNIHNYFLNKTSKSFTNFIETSNRVDKKQVFLKNLINDFHFLVSIGIILFLSLISNGNDSANFIYYIFVSDLVINKSNELERLINSLLQTLPSFEYVDNILNTNYNERLKRIDKVNSINFKNVCFHYDINCNTIINNLNANFYKGDRVRITGQNGSGKSTLVKIITGLLFTKKGEISINNIPIQDISYDDLKRNIVYIGQNEFIINDTIQNYLSAIAGYKLSEDETLKLMEKVNFDFDIKEVKDGGNSLSGGQRKKLMLMKLLLRKEASVVIIDEVEAGMDKETLQIWQNIEQNLIKNSNAPIIFKISHNEDDCNMYNKEINLDKLVL